MKNIRRLPLPNGGTVDAREEEFDVVKEEWCVYRLKDGGTVRIRATANSIFRILDAEGKPTYTPDGQPNVLVQQAFQVVASE